MDNKVKVETKLGVVDFVTMVDAIVAEFFDDDGNYTPHIGRLNAMRLFYNECVLDDTFGLPHNITDALEMDALIKNEEFICLFTQALVTDNAFTFDFANAYDTAREIVDAKKDSVGRVVDAIKNLIGRFSDMLAPMFSEDNIKKLEQISKDISSGKLSDQSIVEAFGNSDLIDKIAGNK